MFMPSFGSGRSVPEMLGKRVTRPHIGHGLVDPSAPLDATLCKKKARLKTAG
jgi:hypothetical protein